MSGCHKHRECHDKKKCIKIVLQPPPVPEPFIGMSVFKRQDQVISSNLTEPQVIGQWSDERVDGVRRFYIEPDVSFNTQTGKYTVTKSGKYRSAINIQTENRLEGDIPRNLSIRFAFRLNGQILHEFFARGDVRRETTATTVSFQLNEGDIIDLLAFPVPNTTGSYSIVGTVDPNGNPIRSNWAISRFAD